MDVCRILLFLHKKAPCTVLSAHRQFLYRHKNNVKFVHNGQCVKKKIGGAVHGDSSPHHHTTYNFGLEVFAVFVADRAHLRDDVIYIHNHFHHTYLLIVNSWVDFIFDFWFANVIYCES